MNDVLINKIQNIQRCIRRAREEYQHNPTGFSSDFTRQDAAMLNVIRACDSAIDLANHLIRTKKLGVPVSSADSFMILSAERIITPDLSAQLRKMIGFRNIAVHQYATVDMDIVISVITTELNHLNEFAGVVWQAINPGHIPESS